VVPYDIIFFGLSPLKVVFLHSPTSNILETLPLRVLDPKKLEKRKKERKKNSKSWEYISYLLSLFLKYSCKKL
jgi:hypothetical protein